MTDTPRGSNADEWALFLSEHTPAYAAVQIATIIERLEKQVYVPGLWRCPKCEFSLVQANLNARDGTVTARDNPGDKCPNCNSPLWRTTERQAGTELGQRCEEMYLSKMTMKRALEMVCDADEDRKRDGLEPMPPAARAKIDAALREE